MERTIGIVGLGYIGLPLALSFCEKGYRVIGVDIDEQKVERLGQGLTNVQENWQGETLQELLSRHISRAAFIPTTNMAVAAWEGRAYIVTVGIPVTPQGLVNEEPLLDAIAKLGRVIKQNDLVLVRSTLVPGMMGDKIIPLLQETSHMMPGIDFHVAYAAERVAEGRAMYEFQTLGVVVAGLTPVCAEMAANLLRDLTSGDIHVTDLRTAEATKVIENMQRDVNIALAHQIAQFANYHDIDVYELIRMANTHPRVNLLEPGIGVGGYCIPNAYHYLEASVASRQSLPLLKLARTINETVPHRTIAGLVEQLYENNKPLGQSTVAILGLGMKDYSNDIRQSPALKYAELLLSEGALVRAFDPTVPMQLPYQVDTLESCLKGADAVIVAAWQQEFGDLDFQEALNLCSRSVVCIDLKKRLEPFLKKLAREPVADLSQVV